MKRTPLKPRSKKRARFYRTLRIPLVAELLADHPMCQRCQQQPAVDVHEIQTRARGGSLLNRENLALLCRPCHSWVTVNVAEATAEGWLRHSWETA